MGFLNLFSGIKGCVSDTKRAHVEELLDDSLEVSSSSLFSSEGGGEGVGMTLLGLFLAMIGSFGVTSSELVYAAAGGGGMGGYNSYSYVGGMPQVQNHTYGGYAAQAPTKKRPPKPSVWVHEVVSQLDVAAFYELNWDTVYGSIVHARWVAVAVQEAIERLSEHNSYDWLRIYPLVKKLNISPRIVHATPTKKEKKNKSSVGNDDPFISVAVEVCEHFSVLETVLTSLNSPLKEEEDAAEALLLKDEDSYVTNEHKGPDPLPPPRALPDTTIQEKDGNTTATAATSATGDLLDLDDIGVSGLFEQAEKAGGLVDRKRVLQKLMKDWLHGLIVFAPSLSTLSHLLALTMINDGDSDISRAGGGHIPVLCHDDVVAALASKIVLTDLDKNDHVKELIALLNKVAILRCPEIATAFLKNEDMDDHSVTLCNIVSLCVKDKLWWNLDPALPDYGNQAAALTGKWHALSVAAKEFILRKHGTQPEPPMETVRHNAVAAPTSGNYWGNLWNTAGTGQVERRPKVLSDEELREQYRQLMAEALEDVNLLMTEVPLFSIHSNGLFFELGRCWFLKGAQHRILDALCFNAQEIAKEIQVMDNTRFAAPVVQYVNEKALRFIEDMCRVDSGKGSTGSRQVVHSASLKVLRTVTDVLSSRDELAHTLLFELVRSVTGTQIEVEESSATISATAKFAATLMSNLSVSPPPATMLASSNVHVLSPALSSILEGCSMWERLLLWFKSSQADALGDTPLTRSLDSVRNTLSRTSSNLQTLTLKVTYMQALMVREQQFYSLLDSFGIDMPLVLRDVFVSSAQQVRHFDATLEQVQTYACFFCTCGVKVQATEEKQLVERLRRRFKSLQLCELEGALNEQNIIALPYTSWLYALRSSELFLYFWRLVGREICLENIGGGRRGGSVSNEQKDEGDEQGDEQGLGLGALFNETPGAEGLLREGGGEDEAVRNIALEEEVALQALERQDDESEEDFAARVATLQQARMQRLQQQFEAQDRRARMLRTVEEVELTQEEVVGRLLPRVQAVWGQLALDTFTGSILMSELDSSFSTVLDSQSKGADPSSGNSSINSDDQVIVHLSEELRLLAIGLDHTTCNQIIAAQNLAVGSGISTIISTTTHQLRDYLFLHKLLKWIPCLVHVHEILESLFVTPLAEDPFRLQLLATETEIQARLTTLTLRDMSGLVNSLQSLLQEYNTGGQVDFVAAMSLSADMTNWLLAQSSTEEFNRLLQVLFLLLYSPLL